VVDIDGPEDLLLAEARIRQFKERVEAGA